MVQYGYALSLSLRYHVRPIRLGVAKQMSLEDGKQKHANIRKRRSFEFNVAGGVIKPE